MTPQLVDLFDTNTCLTSLTTAETLCHTVAKIGVLFHSYKF